MVVMSIREAINRTIAEEMERDADVIALGEDIVGGMGTAGGPEAIGGIWGATGGLYARFGPGRVIDTPISESAIVGAAAGAALAGKRPIAELMFADFVGVSLDQLWNQMAKFRYMFGGKTRCPAVIRLIYGAGMNAAAQHSQSVYAMMTAIPGLKIALPATPADAKGLLTEAIRGDDPVPDPRGRRRDDRDLRANGRFLRKGGGQARRGRYWLRRHRPAHDEPAG